MKVNNLKKYLAVVIVILFSGTASVPLIGGNAFKTGTSQHFFNLQTQEDIVVKIFLSEPSILGKLLDKKIDILRIEKSSNSAIALVSLDEFKWLENMGFAPNLHYKNLAEMDGWTENPKGLLDFHNYAQMTTALQAIANNYPTITQLYDLGHSVQGRVLWGLKITDNPTVEEDEPEVRICGLHHGNEYMSAELSLLMAQYLTLNYGNISSITDLVDNREIWIIPMVNPDGRESGSRYNANGVDINRDYGYMWEAGWGSPSPFSQPEIQAMRANALNNTFVLSLSYHTTETIVNYIWNYKHQQVPDNTVVQFLSNKYASHNGYEVIDGYDWYQTRGDTNDFSYGCRGDIDWTIETQNSNIPATWELHRVAMLEIIEAADMGIRGIVTDADTGQPISGTIWVEEANWPSFTDPQIGDYHHVLLPGTYTVHYRANGYIEQVHTLEVTSSYEPIALDVALEPESNYYAYQVTMCNFYDPFDYPNNFQNNPTEAISALGPSDSVCASLGVGGMIVLDMGQEIVDIESEPDFKVFEGGTTSDGYRVYVSENWNGPWTDMGLATGTEEFDLEDVSLEAARYVKIVDDNNGSPTETNPGVDIDAVENLAAGNIPNRPEKPNGPTTGVVNVEYTFSSSTTDPQQDQVYYMFSWGDGSTSEWLGPYESGVTVQASHSWSQLGNYEVKVKAKDTCEAESSWSQPLAVSIVNNTPPNPPAITGPAKVKTNVKNDYILNAIDLDEDDVSYYVDWGDGTNSGWTVLSASGVDVTLSHTWTKKGTYTVKAKAKDIYNAESDWTILEVKVPRVISINDLFLQFLQNHPHMFPILRRLMGL